MPRRDDVLFAALRLSSKGLGAALWATLWAVEKVTTPIAWTIDKIEEITDDD